ncbi:MAG: flagellar biosynthesis anti-sigma factor FlgM [Deltaproteobacteria bacterium]|nr:flagellar biosynthesis anti-sigma factor FlgM [Deltaproteobacteria bacterium]
MSRTPNPLGSSDTRTSFTEALRTEKLERIRRRVETGTYFVDLELLATRIVDDGGIR